MDSKKLIIYLVALSLLASSLVLAEKGGNSVNKSTLPPGLDKQDKNPGGDDNPTVNKSKGKSVAVVGPGKGNLSMKQVNLVVKRVMNETVRTKQKLELQLQNISNQDKQKVFRNQNRIRDAVMTLLVLRKEGNFSGGIGKNISAIARNFSNSVNKTIQAEQRIHERQGFMRMLFGGDENAAETIQSELNRNRITLQKLDRIQEQLDPGYQSLMQNQTQLIQQEQERLMELAQQEKQDKGLLGWLFK